MSLQAAAEALSDLAANRAPDRALLLAGAMALETQANIAGDRELLDAAAGLRTLATGGTLTLDKQGRERAAHLAAVVRKLVCK